MENGWARCAPYTRPGRSIRIWCAKKWGNCGGHHQVGLRVLRPELFLSHRCLGPGLIDQFGQCDVLRVDLLDHGLNPLRGGYARQMTVPLGTFTSAGTTVYRVFPGVEALQFPGRPCSARGYTSSAMAPVMRSWTVDIDKPTIAARAGTLCPARFSWKHWACCSATVVA